MPTPLETVGFIGLGDMGAPIARLLLAKGYALVVHDINPAAATPLVALGARAVGSCVEVGNECATVLVSVPNPDATKAVTLAAGGLCEGTAVKTYIDLSTTGSSVAKEVAAALSTQGIATLDAPVTGGMTGAARGTLTIMVSGPRAAYDASVDIFATFCAKQYFVGEGAGQAQVVKLINNLLSATALAVTSEAFVLGAKAGIDADVLLDVINNGTGRNTATDDKFPRSVLPRKFNGFARTAIIYKDVTLCLDEAETLGVPMWIGNSVKQLLGYAISQGAAMEDMTTLVQHLEKWVGVEVRGKAAGPRA